MTVCVVGSGAREHALALALARSDDVVVTPGNPGMPGLTASGHAITITDTPAEELDAALVVIGPEAPLVDGLADRLRAAGRLVLGPGADGAALEGSKAFMKEVLAASGVPTARYGSFDDAGMAIAFLDTMPGPWVIKTDGLAAGKGVLVAVAKEDAIADIEDKLAGRSFGDAGRRVIVEEGLGGPEFSVFFLCDGERVLALPPAQDFKRIGDGDLGPNTGGMGSYSPVPWVDQSLVDEITASCVVPLVAELRRRGIDYRGVLYGGFMLTPDGPKVLEYNVRFGDPETQVVLPRIENDLVALLTAAAAGDLSSYVSQPAGAGAGAGLQISDDAAVCVVMAASGYPEHPIAGAAIKGLDEKGQATGHVEGVTVLHAGTRRSGSGEPFSVSGGRVLGIMAVGPTLADARDRAYAVVDTITWDGVQVRRDIAAKAATGVRA